MDSMSSSTHKEQTSGEVSTATETIELDSDPADENLQLIVDKDCFTLNSNYVDVIDVDNEDVDVEIIETVEQPIVIDDDVDCVEVTEVQSKSVTEKEAVLLEKVCNENVLLSQIIEECINLDDSGSMKRIINKTLIPLYINCSIIYKNCDEFQNSLKRTMRLLETAPRLKYSHLKDLCELMKYDYYKKKLPLLIQREARKDKAKKRRVEPIKLVKRKKVNISQEWKVAEQDAEVIVIDDHVNYVPYKNPNINNKNNKTSESNINKTTENNINNKTTENNIKNKTTENNINNKTTENNINNKSSTSNTQILNRNKENIINNKNKRKSKIPNKMKQNESNNNRQNNSENRLLTSHIPSGQDLLRPSHSIESPIIATEFNNDKVETLENDIKELKKELAVLEEMEVTSDDNSSPYLKCEQIKANIVNKYKKICLLMGTEVTKRHEVKLQVATGHPTGPAKCLENYLNDNIDDNGDPPFPDIFEVVECVEKADKIYKLNWNRKQIVQEAESLLKIYGKALQKRRMKREWRDMKSLIKEEMIDPADFDPALEARLMENKRIGLKNEEEVLNRYAQLEKETTTTGFSLTVENDDESDSEYEIDTGPSLNNSIVNNTSVDIVNNIYLDIVKDTGVDVSNNTSRNIVNTTPNPVNNTDLNVVNSNSVTINNIINNVIENLLNVSPNTSINIVNNAHPNTVNTNSVTINNTINNGLDVVNNTNVNIVNNPRQNIIDNTVNSTTNINNEKDITEEKPSPTKLFNTKVSTEELLSTATNVTSVIIFDDTESSKELEEMPSQTTKIDNIEYNRTILIEDEISDNELLDIKPCTDNVIKEHVPSTDKLPDSILSTDKLSDSIISTDNLLKGDIVSSDKLSDFIIETENTSNVTDKLPDSILSTDNFVNSDIAGSDKLSEFIIKTENPSEVTDKFPNSECSTDKLLDSVPCSDNLKERDESSNLEETELEVKVKEEREDITKLLEEFGNDFTATVFDIEDPFLVIEISDSSDSEDEDTAKNL